MVGSVVAIPCAIICLTVVLNDFSEIGSQLDSLAALESILGRLLVLVVSLLLVPLGGLLAILGWRCIGAPGVVSEATDEELIGAGAPLLAVMYIGSGVGLSGLGGTGVGLTLGSIILSF